MLLNSGAGIEPTGEETDEAKEAKDGYKGIARLTRATNFCMSLQGKFEGRKTTR
jgi:hypothetical protein